MAERMKQKLIETYSLISIVGGPDSYRRMPYMIYKSQFENKQLIDTKLSIDETYADIIPYSSENYGNFDKVDNNLKLNKNNTNNFVTIMRGCNNMCSFCIVPFTRGRERSKNYDSIRREIDNI